MVVANEVLWSISEADIYILLPQPESIGVDLGARVARQS